ncbi:biopolymer transporter ExbD [Campylobacter sp. RM12640]|uniref:ExbD/TolR family protein n=1 Tax=unclassified Campylobacter TaxID=2593542 RepID=UPI001D8AB5CF|nr:biopolymer transporter ExbD [Campylobacter sp. RM12640]MBZ7989882.1 biopolymer transporter ExbD [Campylobacter sp. RM12635]MBZ8008341.1 biopolymer transporter ExbD [Campylobacter sp. RM9334]
MNKPTLNIIPLIDVMLVIIIISLSVQSFVKYKAIDVTPPLSKSEQNAETKANVLIISKEFELRINDDLISLNDLVSKINKDEKLNIICDEELYFKDFIKVIYELKNNNFNNYTILTRLK